MSNKNKEDLIKKYNFSSEYIKDYKKFKSEIINKKIIPYQVEFQPPPRGKNLLVRVSLLLWKVSRK